MAINYKILAQAQPSGTPNADLYTVPAATETVVSTLAIANITATAATCRVYLRDSGATAANGNALLYDVTIAGRSTSFFTIGITLKATDIVTVQTGTSLALTFHLMGSEIV